MTNLSFEKESFEAKSLKAFRALFNRTCNKLGVNVAILSFLPKTKRACVELAETIGFIDLYAEPRGDLHTILDTSDFVKEHDTDKDFTKLPTFSSYSAIRACWYQLLRELAEEHTND